MMDSMPFRKMESAKRAASNAASGVAAGRSVAAGMTGKMAGKISKMAGKMGSKVYNRQNAGNASGADVRLQAQLKEALSTYQSRQRHRRTYY